MCGLFAACIAIFPLLFVLCSFLIICGLLFAASFVQIMFSTLHSLFHCTTCSLEYFLYAYYVLCTSICNLYTLALYNNVCHLLPCVFACHFIQEKYLVQAAKYIDQSELSKRVAQWEDRMAPKLVEEVQIST